MMRPTFPILPDPQSEFVEDRSCNVDVDDELQPELVDNPGTTRGTKLSVLHIIVFPHRNIRGLRRLFQAIEQLAFPGVIALSRRD